MAAGACGLAHALKQRTASTYLKASRQVQNRQPKTAHLLALNVEETAVEHELAPLLALVQPPVVDLPWGGAGGRDV